MGRAQTAYYHLPPLVQTVALNAYGIRTLYRYSAWQRVLSSLKLSETWTRAQQKAYVASRLRTVISAALEGVQRYASFRHLASQLRDTDEIVLEVLRALPPVSRQEILADPNAFMNYRRSSRRLVRSATSGTTGTPFTALLEPETMTISDALWWRRTAWAGYRRGDWIARMVGDPVIALSDREPKRPYRLSWTDHRLYLSTYHLSESTAPMIAEALVRRKPRFLMGYPSALDAFARLTGHRLRGWQPRAVLYSSEPLYGHQRSAIEAIVSAPIRGLYGCAERVVSAAECDHGGLHLGLVDGFVEGQFGEASDDPKQPPPVTGLLNTAMPLIRYELGDEVVPRPDVQCRCGRTLPVINPVITKNEDMVVTPSGRRISASILTWAFKEAPGLLRSQVVQREDMSLDIRLQASEIDREVVERIRRLVEDITFGELPVNVTRVAGLTLTEAGKTRFVVSRCVQRRC